MRTSGLCLRAIAQVSTAKGVGRRAAGVRWWLSFCCGCDSLRARLPAPARTRGLFRTTKKAWHRPHLAIDARWQQTTPLNNLFMRNVSINLLIAQLKNAYKLMSFAAQKSRNQL